MTEFEHDKDALLDYTNDWAAWLPAGDTIAASTFAASDPAVKVAAPDVPAPTHNATQTTVWIKCVPPSGVVVGNKYTIINHITTVGGREEDHSFRIKIKEH